MLEHETVHSFQQAVSSAGLENVFKDKRLVSIYQKLISNVLAYWHTVNKIDDILASRFDSHSEKRLELLQAKASRAKSVFKNRRHGDGQKTITPSLLPCWVCSIQTGRGGNNYHSTADIKKPASQDAGQFFIAMRYASACSFAGTS